MEASGDQPHDAPAETNVSAVRPLMIPPWIQLVGLPLIVLFAWAFASAAGHAVLLFAIASMISLLLNPIVRWLSKTVPRALSVLIVYLVFALAVAAVAFGVVNAAVDEVSRVQRELPSYIDKAEGAVQDLQDFLNRHGVEVNLVDEGRRFLARIQDTSLDAARKTVSFGSNFVTTVAELLFNIVLVAVISIYMLLDAPRIGRFIARPFPDDSHVESLFQRVERAISHYVRGQTLVCLTMGVSAAAGLWLLGITNLFPQGNDLALVFGAIVAVTEVIPYVGPILGALPPIIVALANEPVSAIFVALLFLALHQIEGHIVIPKLMSSAVGVHPLVIIFSLLAGTQIIGPAGAILVLPIVAAAREVVIYVVENVRLESWTSQSQAMPSLQPAHAASAASVAQATAAAASGASDTATPPSPPELSPTRRRILKLMNWRRDARPPAPPADPPEDAPTADADPPEEA